MSCLTNVPAGPGADEADGVHVYRRPRAFATSKLTQALAVATTVGEIMLRERPQAVQLATTTSEGYFGLWLRRWLVLPYMIYAHGNEVEDDAAQTSLLPEGASVDYPRLLGGLESTCLSGTRRD